MLLPGHSRLKIGISLLLVGGIVHLILNEYPTFYENFDIGIGGYLKEYRDPMDYVLENSASRAPSLQTSTADTLDAMDNVTGVVGLETTTLMEDVWLNHNWTLSRQQPGLEDCPKTPPGLVGPIRIWQDGPSLESIAKLYPFLEKGGHGRPANCTSRHRMSIVIPYRDREEHLRILLHNLHSLLTKQQLDYSIIIVEQIKNQTFNRAKLMNIGYAEGMKLYPWECFIFHDVDLLPEDDRNLYTCPTSPRHMSVAIDKFNYKLPYGQIFGGISALTVDHLKKINGFSNDYWGWGGEDDDLSTRVRLAGYNIARYPSTISRYKMIKHSKEERSNPVNRCRYKLMSKTSKRWQRDGLNSLNYKVVKLDLLPLYTHILVDLNEEESRKSLKAEVRC